MLGGGVGCLFAHTSAVIVVGVCGSFVACHMRHVFAHVFAHVFVRVFVCVGVCDKL